MTPEEAIAAAAALEAARADERSVELADAEPPIVARCVVEVRSDGSLSIARGVFETPRESVLIEGRGRTPVELVAMLARGAFTEARVRVNESLRGLEHRLLGAAAHAKAR